MIFKPKTTKEIQERYSNGVIENGQIISTQLGYEDHGIFTFYLTISFERSEQAFCGPCMDDPVKGIANTLLGRTGTAEGMNCIIGILQTLHVDSWECVPKQYVRIIRKGDTWSGPIQAIGHIIEDRWYDSHDIFMKVANSK